MIHSQENFITLPERPGIPACKIFTKQYVQKKLGERNTIILLPGGPGNDMGMYDDPAMSLAQTFFQVADVILFDPRACGKSERCDIEWCSLDHYIDDVEAIRQHFNINPDHFFVFGQSYGSIVALGYSIRYAESLKKLLLIGGVVSSAFYAEAKANLNEIGTPEQIAFAEKLWNGAFDGSKKEITDFYRLMSPLYSYSFEPGEPPLEIGYNIDIMNYGWGTFLKHFNYENQLINVKCETLILLGENEWIMPRSHIDMMYHSIPNCSLKIYPKCMHMLWIDQWEIFVEDALNFLEPVQSLQSWP
ncbi:MAG: alpha/beta fold hydrolase [Legionellales bacterium]|nr:alpha/beta fold hydrolase [Legionellales bacterium]